MATVPVESSSALSAHVRWPFGAVIVVTTMVLSAIGVAWSPGLVRDSMAVSVWLLVTAIVAGLLVARVPRNPVGWLLAVVAVCVSLQGAATATATLLEDGRLFAATGWVSHWVALPGFGALAFIALLFPTGRLPSRKWRWVAWVLAVGLVGMTVTIAFAPGPVGGLGIANPLVWHAAADLLVASQAPVQLLVAAGVGGAVVSLVSRYRRSSGDERQQLKWFLLGIGVLVVTLLFAGLASGPVNELSFVLALVGLTGVPVTIGLAVLEYHLYDIDQVINRALVYGILTVIVVGLYVAVVGLVAVTFDRALGVASSLVATALVAVAFQPLRTRLQRLVDRLVYGQRNDPGAAIAALAQQLQHAPNPATVPSQVVATVSAALKLPYVAIELDDGRTSVEHGKRPDQIERIQISWQDELLGDLLVGGDRGLRARDRELLVDLAHQAAPALAAIRLNRALERSRQQLVVAREEGRRRLRGDLHDGLGPQLAGLAMGLDAVSNLLERDPIAAREAVTQLRARSVQALETVRAVSRGLRPPVLDELGLASAIRQHATTLATDQHRIDIDTDGDLAALPAAVEVATYHICLEATTNAARHARATVTSVRLRLRPGTLEIAVDDDGRGLPGHHEPGVGLLSMRARAEELGGSLTVTNRIPAGTTVRAVLPLGPS